MKIQFILSYSDLYGANRSANTIITYLHQNSYDINVLLPSYGDMYNDLVKKNIPCKVIRFYPAFLYIKPQIKFLALPFLLVLNCFVFPYFLLYIKKINPQIIYSNSSAENIGIILSKILKIKHISHIREFMLLDYKGYFIFGERMKKKYIELSDGVIYVSESVKKTIENGETLKKYNKVIYNGISSSNSYNVRTLNKKNIRIGLVGIFDPSKGQDIAIDYLTNILLNNDNFSLHFYGDKNGRYKKNLLKRVNLNGIENKVFFHGFVKDIDTIYNEIDILLMFSRNEGFGRVTVESMLRGVPVIGYNNAGTSEIIEHKKDGLLFNNKEEFISCIHYLLNESSYKAISKQSILSANKKFNVNKYCEEIESFIIDVSKIKHKENTNKL